MDSWRKPSLSCPAVNGTGEPPKALGECWLTHCAALTPIGVLALIGFQIQGVNIYAIIHIGVSGLSPDAPVCVMGSSDADWTHFLSAGCAQKSGPGRH